MHVRRLQTLLLSTSLLLLLGCGSSSPSHPDGGGGSATVNGKVLDSFGAPLANRKVMIGASSTTTNASGQFTLSGVATPYDLVIIDDQAKAATVYAQLTRLDPTLLDLGTSSQAAFAATVGGALTGGDPLSTLGTLTAVSWGSPETSTYDFFGATPYALSLSWSGASTTTGAVHGLQWTIDQNGTVNGYHSYGVKSGVSVASGATVSNADIQLGATTTDQVSATITAPAGHEIAERDVLVTFDDGAHFLVSQDALDGGALQVPAPTGIGAKIAFGAAAATSDGSSISIAQVTNVAPGTTGTTLSLPAPALVTAPAYGASGVDTSTDLVWTPLSGGIHVLFLSGIGNDPTYVIFTGGTRARIPDLSAQGLGLPSGHSYDFGLVGIGPYASIDAFAEKGTVADLGFQTINDTRFTTR